MSTSINRRVATALRFNNQETLFVTHKELNDLSEKNQDKLKHYSYRADESGVEFILNEKVRVTQAQLFHQ